VSALGSFIQGGQSLNALCPHCKEVFQVLHARFIFPSRDPGKCEYADLLALENLTYKRTNRLERIQERQSSVLEELRIRAIAQGKTLARKQLLKIDQVFSARKVDPQDVKVLFDPVDYIVFRGLNHEGVNEVRFVNHEPKNFVEERIVRSIAKVIKTGDVEFNVLRVNKDGTIAMQSK
jgi:predicted Holliday junction resolvase-like endonuclease